MDAFQQALRERGYAEGRNIIFEVRNAEGKWDRLPDLAAELVALNVDVIFTQGSVGAVPLKKATARVPIPVVFTAIVDPVATGVVASLAHPGGNMTGPSMMSPEVVQKQLQLLRDLVSDLSRVALLRNPTNPADAPQAQSAELAAEALGIRLQSLQARSLAEIEAAFDAMAAAKPDGLVVLGDQLFFSQRANITRLAEKARLPAVYNYSEYVEAGGLLAYGVDNDAQWRHAATYVAKILAGAKAADLPVEQPTYFRMAVNLAAAKSLGLTVPQSLLVLANQVIE
jgi:putative ABC transport system substrate-binding protein